MSCYFPIRGFRTPDGVVFNELRRHDILGSIELPCGMCVGCRMRRASDWTLRVMHESSLWATNCFVTLTYARDKMPPDGSLEHRDFQLFFKRLRKHFKGRTIRFYMCGEYGPLNLRPHYHACLFNVDFADDQVVSGKSASGALFFDSALLARLWGHGIVSVQPLCRETAGYCARYIMAKKLGVDAENGYTRVDADGNLFCVNPEYSAMSLKPGIGAGWYDKYKSDVFPHDFVVSNGVKLPLPRYYDKLMRRSKDVVFDEIEFAREKRAKLSQCDNTDERRVVREVVHKARVNSLKRDL